MTSRIETFAGAMFALLVYARRQDILLADDARGRERSVSANGCDRDQHHGRHRDDVRGHARRPGPGLREGSVCRCPPRSNAAGRVRAVPRSRRPAGGSSSRKSPPSTAGSSAKCRASCRPRRAELAKTGVIVIPEAALARLTPEERAVHASAIAGRPSDAHCRAVIPSMMAIIYLCLLIYFRSIGGYKTVHLRD